MKSILNRLLLLTVLFAPATIRSQTLVPNGDFELWGPVTGNYQDPQYWDTPNPEIANIPFFGITVVSKSTDHESGSYSVKLETKHLSVPPLYVPGFITLGNLTLNLAAGTYSITGGAPIADNPTHLKGYFKYFPKGGDSCVVAIGLLKTNGNVRDTIGSGYYSSKDSVPDWTPFSAWIDYTMTGPPDSMNVFALSTAQEVNMHVGTTLYLDNLFLDYTVSTGNHSSQQEIDSYLDRETKRLLVFFNFEEPCLTSVCLFDMMGRKVAESHASMVKNGRQVFSTAALPRGIYVLEVLHSGNKFSRKFFINSN
jgi:hypothetical protein